MSQTSFEVSQSGIPNAPVLLQPELKTLYANRIARLTELIDADLPIKDYLAFVRDMVSAQVTLLRQNPLPALPEPQTVVVDFVNRPFDKDSVPRDPYWRDALRHIVETLLAESEICKQPAIAATLMHLKGMPDEDLETAANQLFHHRLDLIGVNGAPFMWTALSSYFTQLVRRPTLQIEEGVGVARQHCPMCGCEPVASVVTALPPEGTRYLHCALCGTEWHVVRAQCTNCNSSENLNYWSFGENDDDDAAVKTESCDNCKTHMKILFQTKNAHVDAVADDLASLALDAEMEEKGYGRSSMNPFLFQGGKEIED
jgi:FdhE protein